MRMQGHYTAAGPHLSRLPRWFMALLGLAVLALVAVIAMIIVEQRAQAVIQPQAPAMAVARVQPQSRAFADEIGYVPTAQEYALLDEGYMPLAPTAPPVVPDAATPRIFADEIAAATIYDLSAVVIVPEMQQFEITPRIGPR